MQHGMARTQIIFMIYIVAQAPAIMGPQNTKNGRDGSTTTEIEDIVFIDGERIEIAGTYPDVETAIEALHKGD